MRRRRHKLEVSTFPFLAVLLCAMGSLILMLLVLDRRAKAAARERAQRAAEQISTDELRLAEQRRQEWERRRQALHADLEGQERELRGKMTAVESDITAAQSRLQAERERRQTEQDKMRHEREDLAHLEEDVAAHHAEVARSEAKVQDSEQELRRLTGDLKMLERTLAELKAIRQRQQQTVSVVPYRGRRGSDRAPLYLECASTGLIFHPDRKTFISPRSAADEVRAEVQRRISQQRVTLTAGGQKTDAAPYLLMLVRPDGISTYYLTMKCLQGLDLDFGYELIDADWVLDFPSDGADVKPQPWMVAERPTATQSATTLRTPRAVPVSVGAAASENGMRGAGGASGATPGEGVMGSASEPTTASGTGTGTGTGTGMGMGTGMGPWRGARNGSGAMPGMPVGMPGSDRAVSHGGFAPWTTATLGTAVPAGEAQGVNFGGPIGSGEPGGAPAHVAAPPGGGTTATGGASLSGSPLGVSAGGETHREGSGPSLGLPNVPAALTPNTAGAGAVPHPQETRPPASAAQTGGPPSTSSASVGGVPHSPTPLPASASAGARVTSDQSGQAATQGGRGDQGGDASASETSGEKRPGLRPLDDPTPRRKRNTPPPTVRPALLGGDRDYLILVECRSEKVVVHPYGNAFSAESLAPGNGGGALLQETIGRMITRRQATVRPGELPYRPQVRFLVRPDGLRALHRAYPVLDELHIPLTRQNLEADEEVSIGEY